MTIHPITPETPACYGLMCPLHPECARYAAVEGSPAVTIGTCEEQGERPLFVQIEVEVQGA